MAKVFNLFDAEDKVLAQAETLLDQLQDVSPQVKSGVQDLIQSYGAVIREQRRLVKLSDRQQSQVAKLNKELAERSRQAEEALIQLKAAQDSLVQAEKLASLGALVGGVAHEINTPVGIALSCASHLADATERLKALYDADDVGVDDFEGFLRQSVEATALVVDNCKRAAQLIGSFKQVAVDRVSAERREFDLATMIEETLISLGPQIKGPGHSVVVECPAGIVVDGYPGILSQIIGNFVMNTLSHGFEPDKPGIISISAFLSPDHVVNMVYSDNGKGIASSHLDRVFDPFFTTKLGQGGSGLGLHIVYNLVTGPLGGAIAVASPPGSGAQFRLSFPAIAPLVPDDS